MGFEALELGYNLTAQQAAEIKPFAERGEIAVDSVHAFCPVPMSAPYGYPEQHLLASLDEDERVMARIMIEKTLDFTAAMGAKAVVLHAGRIFLKTFFSTMSTHMLAQTLEAEGGNEAPGYTKLLAKAVKRRSALARRYYDGFCLSLDTLLPRFEDFGVTLALENLPSIEAFPDMTEMMMLKQRFNTPALAYWHDIGHGQVREYFGWDHQTDVVRTLLPFTCGTHIHDALPLMDDHLPPGMGKVDFSQFSAYGDARVIKVFEPACDVPAAEVERSLQFVRNVWGG